MDENDTETICIANFEVFIESQHQIFENDEEFGKDPTELFLTFSVIICVVFGYKISFSTRSEVMSISVNNIEICCSMLHYT